MNVTIHPSDAGDSAGGVGGRRAILLNRAAGALHSEERRDRIRRTAREVGLDAEIIETESVEEMRDILREMATAGAPVVAVVGGDGTVAQAAQHLAHTDTALGVIPLGTSNNFPAALRLPTDLASQLRVLKEGEIREVDLGRAFNRYFTESAGVGLFADFLAVYGLHKRADYLRGLAALARLVVSPSAYRIRLTIDGEPYAHRVLMCAVANGCRMANGMTIAPDAKLTDGKLDVVIVGDIGRWELISYYRAFRAGTQRSLPKVAMLRAEEVKIDAPRYINVHCDDQFMGKTPVTITAQPRALKVVVNRL